MLLRGPRGADPSAGVEASLADALRELEEILLVAAASKAPLPRATAPRYVRLRETLLKSDFAASLPGFLRQCLTIDRFRDFIHLYHPEPAKRAEFLDLALRSGTCPRKRSLRDVFSDSEF